MQTELPYPVSAVIISAALRKLNECRAKYPGVGGDVDAMNLRFLLEHEETQPSAMAQAAERLRSLSESLDLDARHEVAALEFAAVSAQDGHQPTPPAP